MSKHAFWQALAVTIIVFGLGLVLGFFLESYRADEVQINLIDSETNLLDDQLRNRVIEDLDVECGVAINSTFKFADKIYTEALKLEDFDSASKLSDSFYSLHRRYDLLRALLWVESINLKDKCDEDFHTVVYLYDYRIDDVNVKSKQLFYSRLLLELKEKHPQEIILIPIAVNTELESVSLLMGKFEINSYPVILIDEKEIVEGIVSVDELEKIIF